MLKRNKRSNFNEFLHDRPMENQRLTTPFPRPKYLAKSFSTGTGVYGQNPCGGILMSAMTIGRQLALATAPNRRSQSYTSGGKTRLAGGFASMMCWRRFAKRSLVLAVLFVSLGPVQLVFGSKGLTESPNQEEQTGNILSVRKVLRDQYFLSRYPRIHYYILFVSVRISNQNYCTQYETPVLDEIADVSSATSKDVTVVVKGKTITIQTPQGHKLKTRLVNGNQC